jgi:hypothetical protein
MRVKETAGWSTGWLVGTVTTSPFAQKAIEVAFEAGPVAGRTFEPAFTLRVILDVTDGIGGIGDADGGDDGNGDDDDVFFHGFVGLACIG